MQVKWNGQPLSMLPNNLIEVNTLQVGEALPSIHITVTGGGLDVNRSAVSTEGPLHVHPFRAIMECPDCMALLEICEDRDGVTRGADGTQAVVATMLEHGDAGRPKPIGSGAWVEVWGKEADSKETKMLRLFRGAEWAEPLMSGVKGELAQQGCTNLFVQRVTAEPLPF